MKKIIENTKNQRLVYILIFLLWIFFGLNFVQYKNDSSLLEIDILFFIIFPTLILFIPILYNRKATWFLSLSFSIFFTLWTIHKITADALNYLQQSIKKDRINEITSSILIVVILISVSYVIFKMKPKYKIENFQ
jgi:hypothetical protein